MLLTIHTSVASTVKKSFSKHVDSPFSIFHMKGGREITFEKKINNKITENEEISAPSNRDF